MSTSLWADQVGELTARPPLAGDLDVDVAIVGAGYTGLWTAHSLRSADPELRVVIVEATHAGAGASGVNGGWCVGELAGGLHGAIDRSRERTGSADGGLRLTRAIHDTVDEIGRVVAAEGIECDWAHGGVIRLARTAPQLERQRAEIDLFRRHGFGADVIEARSAAEAEAELAATDVLGGLRYHPCARVHPARLARQLADAVERRGATIVESTPALEIRPGGPTGSGRRAEVVTAGGRIRADVVVRATEAFTVGLPGHRRTLLPFASSMIATEPLPADVWERIGLEDRQTFADDRRMVIYGQRTADDRIAFGGRGAAYRFASALPDGPVAGTIHDRLVATLHRLLPATRDAAITHRWGGVLGIPRDWQPSVGLDRATGLAWAGGYVGEGVAASNLAGRTLADLILQRPTDLVTLPWVDHRSPRWEPEPLRWLGVASLLALSAQADTSEERTGRPSRRGALVDRLR